MTQTVTLVLLSLAVVIGSRPLLRAPRPSPPRIAASVLLQAATAVLLYLTLFPPSRQHAADTLVIATAGTSTRDLISAPAGHRLRLPEAPSLAGVSRVPDLATALRQHPHTRRLIVLGEGLPARDRDTPLPPLHLRPPAPAAGLVELHAPAPLAPGGRFVATTRVQGLPGARVELLDPSGRPIDAGTPDADGYVRLRASARVPGDATFTLRLRDGQGRLHSSLPLPVRVRTTPAPRLRLLAGAPGPEWKYLQRWAADSGAAVQSSIRVGGGMQIGNAPDTLTSQALAELDLLLLDARRLGALAPPEQVLIDHAVREGLGVLLRLEGPLDAPARRVLQRWGVTAVSSGETTNVTLQRPAQLPPAATREDALPTLTRFGLRVANGHAPALLHDQAGRGIGAWQARGLGRIGLLPIGDTYTWVLAGHAADHAGLWNAVVGLLARPQPSLPLAALPAWGWAGERLSLCNLPASAYAMAPDGNRTPLSPDPGAGGCSGYWPREAGWHHIHAGKDELGLLLLDPAQARPMHARHVRLATLSLKASAAPPARGAPPLPGSRWPWLVAFIAAASLLWWLERRHG